MDNNRESYIDNYRQKQRETQFGTEEDHSNMLETNSEFIDFQDNFGEQMPLPEGFLAMNQSQIIEEDALYSSEPQRHSNSLVPLNPKNFQNARMNELSPAYSMVSFCLTYLD